METGVKKANLMAWVDAKLTEEKGQSLDVDYIDLLIFLIDLFSFARLLVVMPQLLRSRKDQTTTPGLRALLFANSQCVL